MVRTRIRYDVAMCMRLLWAAALLVACTKPNPAKYCDNGTCTNPDYPFCDMTGAIGGEAGTCIAVTCMPGSFGECRGDAEVRCNATGNNYDVVQCARGCDPASGCRLCNPSETVCENGQTVSCDASGSLVSKIPCALGCFESEPRCRDIVPSNGLATYLDMVTDPPDMDLSGPGWSIRTSTGEVFNDNGASLSIPSFLVFAPIDGASIRVLIASRARLGDVFVMANGSREEQGPALAIIAIDDLTVEGIVTILGGTGGVIAPSCLGGKGNVSVRFSTQCLISGSGGGSHATGGGMGGGIENILGGGAGGLSSGTDNLVPLRGGCAAGGYNGLGGSFDVGTLGGGAVQLSSRTRVVVTGTIDVNGAMGIVDQQDCGTAAYGGGGGGGVLLEGPSVTLGPGAKLLAHGGSGGQACFTAGAYCGGGGVGATHTTTALDGGNSAYITSGQNYFNGGGGGGGLGRIRINTPDGNYTKSTSSIEDGSLTSGVLPTR